MHSSDLLPGELLPSWQLGPQKLQSNLHQLLVVVPEENLPSLGVDLVVELDQGFPLTGGKINFLNISFSIQRVPLPFQVGEQLAVGAGVLREDLVPGVLGQELVHVMTTGQEQNLPVHLLLNSDTRSLVSPRVTASGVEHEGHDLVFEVPLRHSLEDGFGLNLAS